MFGEGRLEARLVQRPVRGDIGHQAHVARLIFPRNGDSLAQSGGGFEGGFDLAKFDPVTADLHLEIGPAKVVELAVRPAADKVAGAVHPALAREGVGTEAVCGQVGALEVALRHALATDPKLSLLAIGHGRLRIVKDVKRRVGNGLADVDHAVGTGRRFDRGPDRRLGRAVHVQDRRADQRGEVARQTAHQRLAADEHPLQALQGRAGTRIFGQHPGHRGGALQMGDGVTLDEARHAVVISRPGVGDLQHFGHPLQAVEHDLCGDAVVDQAGDLVDVDGFQLFDPRHGVFDRAEQA